MLCLLERPETFDRLGFFRREETAAHAPMPEDDPHPVMAIHAFHALLLHPAGFW